MGSAIAILLFIILSYWEIKLLYSKKEWTIPYYDGKASLVMSGPEALIVVMFATAFIGLSPVIAIRLAFLEIICILGILSAKDKPIISVPVVIYILFLIWEIIGLGYTESAVFGIRMILKYIYPLLLAMFTSAIVKDGEIFFSAGMWTRKIAAIGIISLFIPVVNILGNEIFWYLAAFITGLIPMIVFSFSLADFNYRKRESLLWGIALCLPCAIAVFRTDIFGSAIAISTFFLIKYRLKSLPIIALIGFLGLCVMFYVPSVKNKMFIEPDKVTITDYMTGNIDEGNIQTNMRKFMWEDASQKFYEGHELIGSGTGRIQTFFYTEATDSRRGGQLHNDFLVLQCDNGLIGLSLFILSYVAILLHCIIIYHNASNPYTQMCALVAGASLMGVFVTMFSDNTLSYSMVTLSFPWGFYGMALGLNKNLG